MPRLSRRDLLLASGASVLTYATGAAGAPTAFSTPTSTRLDPDFTFLLRGVDLIDDVLYASDLDNHAIRQSDDWAATWSAPKPLPPNSVADQVTRVIRHNDMAFCAGRDTARTRLSVWRAPLADGDTPFQWVATPLSAQDFTSAKSGTQFIHDERYLCTPASTAIRRTGRTCTGRSTARPGRRSSRRRISWRRSAGRLAISTRLRWIPTTPATSTSPPATSES